MTGEDLRAGILATAQALGMDPVELGTIISYETGGTFNPTQAGPTTQWGQHRGLIQFGEPQAQQYGVDWNNAAASQLGPDGAIAKYFRASGWKPGMGMLDAYSIVNAGAPGRYNASDANNGGAPGTVADKVNNQMAAHRAKAAALLGGSAMPQAQVSAYAPPMQMAQPQVNPMAGMSILERILASQGFQQDANAAPIANIWNALTGKRGPSTAQAPGQRPQGLLGRILGA